MQTLKNKGLIVFGIIFFLVTALSVPAPAQQGPASEVSGEGMAVDLVLLRPLGIAATAIGCVFFVASLPFTIWSGERLKQAGTHLVVEPATYSFVRPLGELKDAPETD